MAEAVALSPRVALLIPDRAAEIVAGWHTDGRWSVFFGGDPVYHFDSEDRLRRAFVAGNLHRSQGTTLSKLTRQGTATETVLLRHDLDSLELSTFLEAVRGNLEQLAHALHQGTASMKQTVPEGADCQPDLAIRINAVIRSGCLLSPTVKG